ncbi:uncharacterized protein TNCV_4926271 [Trichonephila clavipes]|nr:uncharacterized protein TNCV_4926271 [Trichonephila clavipes]
MIQNEYNLDPRSHIKIIHKELHMKKAACLSVPYNLTEHQKEERVRITKKYLELPNDGSHSVISEIVKGDDAYIAFYGFPTRDNSKLWVFEDDPMPTIVKNQ